MEPNYNCVDNSDYLNVRAFSKVVALLFDIQIDALLSSEKLLFPLKRYSYFNLQYTDSENLYWSFSFFLPYLLFVFVCCCLHIQLSSTVTPVSALQEALTQSQEWCAQVNTWESQWLKVDGYIQGKCLTFCTITQALNLSHFYRKQYELA